MRLKAWMCGMAMAALTTPAHAGLDELRLGVVKHNIRTEHGDWASPKEDGPNIEGELVWSSPHALHFLGAPRPYLMASLNTQGNTSFAAAGLYWRWEFISGWALEPGLGFAVHDGEIDNPYPNFTPEAEAFASQHQLLGSRELFRSSLALERELGPHAGVQLYYEHLSNGQIFGGGRNQGLDEAGLRFLIRFNADPAD